MHFRDFMNQIRKYLNIQRKEEQIEKQEMIQGKLEYFKAYKKMLKDTQQNELEIVKDQQLPAAIKENDYSEW